MLIQCDPGYTFHRAERGRPLIDEFDRPAWLAEGVNPVYPMNASYTTVDTGFPQIRFVIDPSQMAVTGTRRLR